MPRLGFDLAVVSGPKDVPVNKRCKDVPAEFFKRNLISFISRPCSQTAFNKGDDVPRMVLFKSIFLVAECCINDFMTP